MTTLAQQIMDEANEVLKNGPVDAEFIAKSYPSMEISAEKESYPSRVQLNAYLVFRKSTSQPDGKWFDSAVTFINRIIDELGPDTSVGDAISYMDASNIERLPENKRSRTVKAIYDFPTDTRVTLASVAEDLCRDCLRDFTPYGPTGKPRIAVTQSVATFDPVNVIEIAEYLSTQPGIRFLDEFEFDLLVNEGEINPDEYDILRPNPF